MAKDVKKGGKRQWKYVATAGRRPKKPSAEGESKRWPRSLGEILTLGAGASVAGAFFLLLARHVPTLAIFIAALLLLLFMLWRRRARA